MIELSVRRLDEAVFRPSKPLTAGMAARHPCVTTLTCHSLAALVLCGCQCYRRQQTRHHWRSTHEDSQGNHTDFCNKLHRLKFTPSRSLDAIKTRKLQLTKIPESGTRTFRSLLRFSLRRHFAYLVPNYRRWLPNPRYALYLSSARSHRVPVLPVLTKNRYFRAAAPTKSTTM